ncbi:Threonine synthase [Candidatus Sulfotelmatobacter kueseliae]|uniref:Threonine synthase n=1 Tax=Candidatus Sulfotelmatobacter kueseliae TaxID=2042962 RepID=A0A2U3L3F9_9BACT|nr:Threonine synthase [Candidatus Sulfotelmatobacter kueseliae]
MAHYELRCRECGRTWGNQPRSICDDCFSPLEVTYDYDALRAALLRGSNGHGAFSREAISQRPPNMWRYSELLPLPQGFEPRLPVGFTPLLQAPHLAERLGAQARNLYIKNDAVCLPTLSFKDRVVAVALAQARAFGFDTVSCSSTGNLANAVAAHAAREGLKAWIFIPADLEPAKILGTNVYGAKVVRIAGNYDQVNRLCSQIADEHRWGFVNVNLRPYYAEGSKTVGFEIAEQLGWRLPDNLVCPMAGGSLITKIKKAFDELVKLGLVEAKEVKFFGAQATGCSPISTAIKTGSAEIEPQKPATIARSLAIGNPADGHYAIKTIKSSGGWSEDVSDPEVIDSIRLLAETEGIFTETAGGVTVGTAAKLYRQDRILPEETTVLCVTGNGLKTTDALAGVYRTEQPIAPKLVEFENYLRRTLDVAEVPGVIAAREEAASVGA